MILAWARRTVPVPLSTNSGSNKTTVLCRTRLHQQINSLGKNDLGSCYCAPEIQRCCLAHHNIYGFTYGMFRRRASVQYLIVVEGVLLFAGVLSVVSWSIELFSCSTGSPRSSPVVVSFSIDVQINANCWTINLMLLTTLHPWWILHATWELGNIILVKKTLQKRDTIVL